MTAAQGLQEKIRAVLVKRISAGDREVPEFADDEDLLTSGVLDSFGFLDFIGALEDEFAIEIEIEALDEERMVTVAGLAQDLEPLTRS